MRDLLADFKISNDVDVLRGRTPEQMLYEDVTIGKNPAIATAKFWLDNELHVYSSLLERGWYMTRRSRKSDGLALDERARVSLSDLARGLLRHYYLATRHSAFSGIGSRPPADMDGFLNLVMEHEIIKRTIDKHILERLP